jgi:eukaryotic-like serine/threonine-protein kinase
MEANMQNFLPILASSRLFPPEQATDLYARWAQTPGAKSGDFQQFSKWLVAQNHLTEYQVSVLLRGHAAALFLDDYKLLDRIGQGDVAGVYKAMHKLGQVVAIKVMPPSKAKDPQHFSRFQREARLAVRLKHPNIVRTFQKGESNGVHYLVMEYLEGDTLQSIMKRRGQLPVLEAVRVIHQSLQGLQHLHEHGMVHRDLQPANLMLIEGKPDSTLNATVKILDVGVAKVLFDDSAKGELGAANLTVQGDMLGMAAYIAPEQARDARRADIRSDIYSLGCMLYESLAAKRPFAGLLGAMARPATERKIPDLRGLNPQVPEALQKVIETMLASDPAQRPSTPETASEALKPFLTAKTKTPIQVELPGHTQAYLQWVESNVAKEEAVDYDLTKPEPGASASGPVSATKPPASSPKAPASSPRQAAVAPVVRKSAPGVQAAPRPTTLLGLSLRDFTMLTVGMGVGILLTLLLAKVLPMLADRAG